MKSIITQDFIIALIKETKNEKYKFIRLGATDFSGTISFLVESEFIAGLEETNLVSAEFFIQFENERNEKNEYREIIKNKRLTKITKK